MKYGEKAQMQKALELYGQYRSMKKVARMLGTSSGRVKRWLITAGVELHKHDQRSEWADEATKLWLEGMSFAKIKKHLNLPVSRVRIQQVVARGRAEIDTPGDT